MTDSPRRTDSPRASDGPRTDSGGFRYLVSMLEWAADPDLPLVLGAES